MSGKSKTNNIHFSPLVENYFNDLVTVKIPDLSQPWQDRNNSLVVSSVCLSLQNIQNIVKIIGNDLEYFAQIHEITRNIIKR
jgi:hypothetical protein